MWELFFVSMPLVLVVAPATISVLRGRTEHDRIARFPMFFVWLAAYSMLVATFGFFGVLVATFAYGNIPGTASEGGKTDGKYYFNWHDEIRTEVSEQTWERAYFVEQLAAHFIAVPVAILALSIVLLFVTRRRFHGTAEI
jgi:hypothetical protein